MGTNIQKMVNIENILHMFIQVCTKNQLLGVNISSYLCHVEQAHSCRSILYATTFVSSLFEKRGNQNTYHTK